jgi:pyruvate kinase
MLTLDAQMISSSVIEEYLLNGMTIARINCAYDDESIWAKMIEAVRQAEDHLRTWLDYFRTAVNNLHKLQVGIFSYR